MELSTFVLFCSFLSSIAAFKLQSEIKDLNDSDNLVARNYEYESEICLEICGNNRGVKCDGDMTRKETITCSCEDKNKIFNKIKKKCESCQCSNGRCVKDNRGRTKCNCKRGYALQDENTCARCDCGRTGKCIFIPYSTSKGGPLYVKKCVCDIGSAEKDGTCVDCQCGENSKCEFEDGEKICYCIEGYAERDGVCTKCDCGQYGECTFENGRKICSCDEDFEEVNGICVDKCVNYLCQNGGACDIQDGKPRCTCEERYYGERCQIDKCDALRCQNGGMCEINNQVAVCRCHDAFTGRECEIEKCSRITCYNAGVCRIQGGNPVCQCRRGYYGDRCEIDECSRTTCYNGGKCRMESGRAVCDCHEGYEGERCEKEKCSRIACYNGGECRIDRGNPVCLCPQGYYGENCEADECSRTTCYNGGKCRMESGRAACDCHERYEGERCEIDKCSNIVCQNGGSCYIQHGKAVCQCLNAYEGDLCETHKCSKVECKNGGYCHIMLYGKAGCVCNDRYTGNNCEVDKCDYLKCRNGGTCSAKDGEVFCDCTPKYTGKLCEKARCSTYYPCQNGGYCKDEVCNCRPGTSGGFCDVIDECPDLCPRRNDVNCTYDVRHERAYCECLDRNFGFYPDTKECKRNCRESECKNGGECKERGYSRFCDCLDRTSGDFCEIIPDCHHMDCGKEAICQYDVKRRSAYCQCYNKDLVLDPKNNTCKRTCEQFTCENGGECKERGYSKFCDCLEGTIGDNCENIPECSRMDCGKEATCQYDAKRKSAYCQCNNRDLILDPEDHKCKRPCRESTDCLNGGTCIKNGSLGSCRCLDGTKGDYCEDIPGCLNKECGENAKCEYDVEKRIAMCKCVDENFAFDTVDYRCKKQCHQTSDCKNGGNCVVNDSNRFCRCLNGTIGDFCENIPACYNLDCGSQAKCAFDTEVKAARCKCLEERLAYDVISKVCKMPCIHDSVCRNGGRCMYRGYNRFCHCQEGTRGDFCENVDICNKMCGNANGVICKYDFEHKIAECLCSNADYEFDVVTKTCKRCDCGGNDISCTIRDGKKICICRDGYSVVNGKCKKQFCTDKKCLHGKCDVINDEEVCSCFEGYFLDGDECRRKECTNTVCNNGTCIVRYGGQEECICPAGYTLRYGSCIRGACSMHTCFGGQCRVLAGELMCVCPEGYSLQGIGCFATVCKIQHCFGGHCVVENDEEVCTCSEGYVLENDVCKLVLCEKKSCFGGQCHIRNGEEVCECPAGHHIVEDVCVRDGVSSL